MADDACRVASNGRMPAGQGRARDVLPRQLQSVAAPTCSLSCTSSSLLYAVAPGTCSRLLCTVAHSSCQKAWLSCAGISVPCTAAPSMRKKARRAWQCRCHNLLCRQGKAVDNGQPCQTPKSVLYYVCVREKKCPRMAWHNPRTAYAWPLLKVQRAAKPRLTQR